MKRSASRRSVVKIDDDRPCGTALCSAIASSSVAIAHHVEDRREGLVLHDACLRSASRRSPDARRTRRSRRRDALAAVTRRLRLAAQQRRFMPSNGGFVDQRTDQSALLRADRRSAALANRLSSARDERVVRCSRARIRRRSVVQRWPAVPTAAKTIAARGEIEIGRRATIAALLPPSSSSARAEALRRRAGRPRGPCASSRWRRRAATRAIVDQRLADVAPADAPAAASPAGASPNLANARCEQRLHRQRSQRRLLATASRPPDRRRRARAPHSTPTPRPGN